MGIIKSLLQGAAPIDPLTAVLNVGNTVIDRLIPDKTEAANAKAQLIQMELNGDLEQVKGQISIDLAEAQNQQSIFIAGWRPFVGWVCGIAFAYAFVLQPFMTFIVVIRNSNFDITKLPKLDISTMLPVLLGMLGLGVLRTVDKSKGTGNGS